jgi:hypothetical protein
MTFVELLLSAVNLGFAGILVLTLITLGMLLGVISHEVAAIALGVATIGLLILAAYRGRLAGAVFFAVTLGVAAIAAAAGPGWLGVWGLLISSILLLLLAVVPAALPLGWGRGMLNLFRLAFLTELLLSVLLIGRQMGVIATGWIAMLSILLLALAVMLGVSLGGLYTPRQLQRIGRLLVTAAVLLLLWPLIAPAVTAGWQATTSIAKDAWKAVATSISASPVGSWYKARSAAAEREAIAESSKTAALRELQGDLQRSHQERWKKAIETVPNLPLAPREWRDLGIPREADP